MKAAGTPLLLECPQLEDPGRAMGAPTNGFEYSLDPTVKSGRSIFAFWVGSRGDQGDLRSRQSGQGEMPGPSW